MKTNEYRDQVINVIAYDFLRALKDNADQSDVQYVSDCLRKVGLNDKVISDIVMLMYENQHNWSKKDMEVSKWFERAEKGR